MSHETNIAKLHHLLPAARKATNDKSIDFITSCAGGRYRLVNVRKAKVQPLSDWQTDEQCIEDLREIIALKKI